MRAGYIFTALFFISLALHVASSKRLEALSSGEAGSPKDQILYLPSGRGLELISFGYRNVLSDILWFNTINYFGKHYRSDRNYEWLSHMCSLVTRLDQKAVYVYEFCGLMLAWEAGKHDDALALLSYGMDHNPDSWKLPYLRGMTYLIFLNNTELAAGDFVRSSKLPEVHPTIVRLAAKKLSSLENTETAIEFLKERISSSSEGWEREALLNKLKELEEGKEQNGN